MVEKGCLQHSWQVMHEKAWSQIKEYMDSNLHTFTGQALDAESTILPSITTWVHDALTEIPELCQSECVIAFMYFPTTCTGTGSQACFCFLDQTFFL